MRKVLSIPLIALILFSGISVKFATHYCRGSVFATKVSLSGKLATCGMDHHEDNYSQQLTITRHCCEDVLSAYTLGNNYLISDYHIDAPGIQGIHFFVIPLNTKIGESTAINYIDKKIRPPGMNDLYSPALEALCVFRI